YTYTYTAMNGIATQTRQDWNTGTGWENNTYTIATYDANNNLSEVLNQDWDTGLNDWVNSDRYTGIIWLQITDVENESVLANDYKLYNNYPNPFNPSTKIKFNVPSISNVTVKVFDVTGKEITSLVNQTLSAGSHEIEFRGNGYASGVYLYKIEAKSLK
ncbi:MAG: T9SS type A sorting domain-containing protein, partial [Ignavibacteriaceae bacterium]